MALLLKFKITVVFLLIGITAFCSTPFSTSSIQKDSVKLIKWKAEDCDNTYDPYRLENRITHIETRDGKTFITVNFSDNCCPVFKPEIIFSDNRLTLLPYKQDLGNCSCNCCFSIEFEIAGLVGKKYDIYFKKKKVELTADYYNVVEPKDSLYNGKKINRTNKYGFKEGIWYTFYENGQVESVSEYPEEELYFESDRIWAKGYYRSGVPEYKHSKDTSITWFEDGEIESEFIRYKSGDTIYSTGINKYDNRTLQRKFFEKSYPFYNDGDYMEEKIYEEKYYPNGNSQYLYGTDTTYTWYENGQLKHKSYKSGIIEYNEDGTIKGKAFHWYEKGTKKWSELECHLYVEFYKNGNIKEIQFIRDEPSGRALIMGVRYYWKWNKEKIVTEAPKKWKGEYPWEKFPEINVPKELN